MSIFKKKKKEEAIVDIENEIAPEEHESEIVVDGDIVIDKDAIIPEEEVSEDEVMEMALDAGADDFIAEDDAFVVHTEVSAFSEVRKYLEEKGLKFFSAQIEMVPQQKITLEGEELIKFQKLIDALEDLDDVQDVYHNVDLPEDEEE